MLTPDSIEYRKAQAGMFLTSTLLVGALAIAEYCSPRAQYERRVAKETLRVEDSLNLELNSKRLWYASQVGAPWE